MKNLKPYFITGLLLLLTAVVMAQDNSVALVNVMPPSPNAAALGKFGNTPVGYFTGLPNISVPLYEIKSGKLKVPVSIAYHPSGIRVEEVASWVGLGWGLDFGGVISRNVRGIGDEESNGYINLNGNLTTNQLLANPSTTTAQQQLIAAGKGIVDNEADMFSFNMGGVSGKFVYNQEAGQFYTIPRMDVKIQYTNPDGFVLTTADGNTYHFTVKETTTTQPICSPATANSSSHTTSWYLSTIISADKKDTVSFSYVTGNYTYSTRGTETKYILESSSGSAAPDAHAPDYSYSLCTTDIAIDYQRISRIRFKNGSLNFNTGTATRCDLADSVLDNITMKDLKGRVLNKWQFNYGYFGASGTPSPCNGFNTAVRLKLNSVQQQSSLNGTLVQQNPYLFTYNEDTALPDRLSFSQDYWGFYNAKATNTTLIPSYIYPSSSGPLYFAGADRSVDSIACKAGILQQITYPTLGTTTYQFESNRINDTTLVPPALHNQAALFGDNAGVITSYDTTFVINEAPNAYNGYHPGGGALVSFSFGDIGCDISGGASTCANLSLVGVSSGTTGFSVNTPVDHRFIPNGTYKLTATFAQSPPEFGDFYFIAKWDEPDSTVSDLRLTGGVRVKKITDYDGADHTKDIIRNFTYTQQSDSTQSSGTVNGLPQVNNYIVPDFYTSFQSHSDDPFSVGYKYDRYFTKLLSYSNQPYIETQGNYTSYSFVTVTQGAYGQNGKSTYRYTQVPDQIDPAAPFESTSNEYARGLLTNQDDYRKTGSAYLPVSRKVNTYTRKSLPAAVLSAGLKLFTNVQLVGYMDNDVKPVYAVYTDTCSWIGLAKTIETTYPNTDTVNTATSVKELSYSPNHYFTASEKITSSRGDTVITAYTYPPDYIGLTATDHLSAGIENLNTSYVISTPVETIAQRKTAASGESNYAILRSYQSASPLVDTVYRTEFTSPASSFAASGVTSGAATKSPAYAPRVAFSYESVANNIAEQNKIYGPHDAYIWDYKYEYPVASVTNADSADIAFTSFEAGGGGRWTIASALRDSTKALTGGKCYNLTNGNVSISGLNTGTTYIVSYWSWSSTGSSSYSVTNGGTPTAGTQLGHWTYYQHLVTGTASITVSGSGPVDELRLYPLGAQMTSYTYDPLVGITTSSDAKGMPTYYEYDNLQRLINIKDLHGNIIKHQDYHYINQ